MRAARFHPPRTIRIEDLPRPEPAPGGVVLRVEACGLCGSDLAKFVHGTARDGEVLGHEVAGIVERAAAGGGSPARFAPGDRVVVAHHAPCGRCHYCVHGNYSMCRAFKSSALAPGGFAEFLVASEEHVARTMFRVPDGLSLEDATFMEPLACAIKAVPRLNLRPGDVVVLFGLGPMGLLFARLLARRHAARLIGVDPIAERRALALPDLVAAFAPDDPALAERVLAETAGRGADAAILLVGRGAVAAAALPLVRDAGVVCLFAASPEESPVPLPLGVMYYRELVLYGSYSPDPDGFALALDLIAAGAVPVADLITERLPLDRTHEAFERAVRGEGMKFMIRPQPGD